MRDHAVASLPIDGIVWSWRDVGATEVDRLLPFVTAADPSGSEAAYWRREACSWLAPAGMPRGITSVECLAGVTLGVFFHFLTTSTLSRHLVVERLRWLELTRPHRSLDALLAILVARGERRHCEEILILDSATTERNARRALLERAETAGFVQGPKGWTRRL